MHVPKNSPLENCKFSGGSGVVTILKCQGFLSNPSFQLPRGEGRHSGEKEGKRQGSPAIFVCWPEATHDFTRKVLPWTCPSSRTQGGSSFPWTKSRPFKSADSLSPFTAWSEGSALMRNLDREYSCHCTLNPPHLNVFCVHSSSGGGGHNTKTMNFTVLYSPLLVLISRVHNYLDFGFWII